MQGHNFHGIYMLKLTSNVLCVGNSQWNTDRDECFMLLFLRQIRISRGKIIGIDHVRFICHSVQYGYYMPGITGYN